MKNLGRFEIYWEKADCKRCSDFPKEMFFTVPFMWAKGIKGRDGLPRQLRLEPRPMRNDPQPLEATPREQSQVTTKGAAPALIAQAFCNFCSAYFRVAMDQWVLCASHYFPWMWMFIAFVSFLLHFVPFVWVRCGKFVILHSRLRKVTSWPGINFRFRIQTWWSTSIMSWHETQCV